MAAPATDVIRYVGTAVAVIAIEIILCILLVLHLANNGMFLYAAAATVVMAFALYFGIKVIANWLGQQMQ